MNWGITMVDKTDFERDEIDLEQLFLAARQTTPQTSGRLQNAVLADALTFMPQAKVHVRQTDSPYRRVRRGVKDVVGGWHALGGLVTASMVGVWIGVAPPSLLDGYHSLALTALYGETSSSEGVLDGFDLAIVLDEDFQ